MRPWLRNKQSDPKQTSTQQTPPKPAATTLEEIVNRLSEQRSISAALQSSSNTSTTNKSNFKHTTSSSPRGDLLFQLIQSSLQLPQCPESTRFTNYLIDCYLACMQTQLDSTIVSQILLQKLSLSSKQSIIIDQSESNNNENIIYFEQHTTTNSPITLKISKSPESSSLSVTLNTISSEKTNNYSIPIINCDSPSAGSSILKHIELHKFLAKRITPTNLAYTLFEGFDSIKSEKLFVYSTPVDSLEQSQPDISSILFHMHLSASKPEFFSNMEMKFYQFDNRLCFFSEKPVCSLFEIIEERAKRSQLFTKLVQKQFFIRLLELLFEVLIDEHSMYLTDVSAKNIGYYQLSKSLKITSLEYATNIHGARVIAIPKQSLRTYDASKDIQDIDPLDAMLFSSAKTLLQVYHTDTVIDKQMQELLAANEDTLDRYQRIIKSLMVGDTTLIRQTIKQLQEDLIKDDGATVAEMTEMTKSEESTNNKDDKVEPETHILSDSEVAKIINDRKKKKKKAVNISHTLEIARGYSELNQTAKAIQSYEEFIAKAEEEQKLAQLVERNSARVQQMISSLKAVAGIHRAASKFTEASNSFRQAAQLAIQHELISDLSLVSYDWSDLGKVLKEKAQLKEYIGLQKELLTLLESALPPNHATCNQFREIVAFALGRLADAHKSVGDVDTAFGLTSRAFAIEEKTFGKDSIQMAISLHEIGTMQLMKGRLEEAILNFQQSIAIKKAKLTPKDPEIARGLNNLAEVYRAQGKNKEALKLFEDAFDIFKEAGLGDSDEVAPTLNNIGIIMYSAGKHAEGITFIEKTLQIETRILGENHPNNAQTMFNMMIMLQKINRLEEAVDYGTKAFRIFLNVYPIGHPTLVQCQQVLSFLTAKINQ